MQYVSVDCNNQTYGDYHKTPGQLSSHGQAWLERRHGWAEWYSVVSECGSGATENERQKMREQ